jgi:hypothetical protein
LTVTYSFFHVIVKLLDDGSKSQPKHVAVNKYIYRYARRCVVRKMIIDTTILFTTNEAHALVFNLRLHSINLRLGYSNYKSAREEM